MKYYDKPKPVSKDGIEKWESFFGISMPEELKVILNESNGPVFYDKSSGKELQFLSAEDSIDYFNSYNFTEYCKNAIPVCMDGCGNFVVYKIENSCSIGVFAIPSMCMGWQESKFLRDSIKETVEMKECVEEILFS